MKNVQRKSKSKITPPDAVARRFLAPVTSWVRHNGTARLVAAYNRISSDKINKTVIYRWLMNSGHPVEPRLGAGLVLRRAWMIARRGK